MNRFKCPACGGNQYTSADTAEGCIYCGHKELEKGDMNKQNQTRCIDYIICPYCGHKFDGQNAINGDMDCMINPECPKCNKEMEVSISVEYMATAIEY